MNLFDKQATEVVQTEKLGHLCSSSNSVYVHNEQTSKDAHIIS